MSTQPPTRLASEDVIISAPLSYAGSAQRIFRLRRGKVGGILITLTVLAVLLVVIAWVVVTAWYLVFGLLLVPYRILRRGSRKRKRQALQHREMLDAIAATREPSAPEIQAASTPLLQPSTTEINAEASEINRAPEGA